MTTAEKCALMVRGSKVRLIADPQVVLHVREVDPYGKLDGTGKVLCFNSYGHGRWLPVSELESVSMKVLPADVYDTLEFSALVFGGIGADVIEEHGEPFCILGHLAYADPERIGLADPVRAAIGENYGHIAAPNNRAVHAINTRKGVSRTDARVSWEEYCAELGIVRGA